MENSHESQSLHLKDRRVDALGNFNLLPDELICAILDYLTPRDIARLACVSRAALDEPLPQESQRSTSIHRLLEKDDVAFVFSSLQLKLKLKFPIFFLLQFCILVSNIAGFLFIYNYFNAERICRINIDYCRNPLQFDGFHSFFLYKRLYRCHTTLDGFSFDDGNVERQNDLSKEHFDREYDGKKPVLLTGLAECWPARTNWTIDKLLLKYGDTAFKISQRTAGKISMKFKDYVSYMNEQHDEDPLYIFDHKFGEAAPGLLDDYNVPQIFQEDFFDVLDRDSRPPFRWLIIGPERSGASWHVDPALSSAWNTLLCGRKRWALYPPGRVPLGVTVHVNDEDGDVNIDTPSSLQWWLDYYPLLADEDKPIECTQLPGETIFVPSGWWHCVLNLETTVAVTQNFVNPRNFEFVCLDMAPGFQHKGVCRVGLLAVDGGCLVNMEKNMSCDKDNFNNSDLTRKEKRVKILRSQESENHEETANSASRRYNLWKHGFSYDINYLTMFLDREKDHYTSPWSSGNCIGPREMREWLSKLWVGKPGMRELIWKGACLAINADKWLECLGKICSFHNFPFPNDDEKLPVGTGSNPVYVMDEYVVKIFVEGGLEASILGLGTELEFYNTLCEVDSPLKNYIPTVLASGILHLENGSFEIDSWDGKKVPGVLAKCNLIPEMGKGDVFPFGIRSKKLVEYRKAGLPESGPDSSAVSNSIWPYLITKRCKGKIYAQLRDELSWEDVLNLASFLGEQLQNLHSLPYPSLGISSLSVVEQKKEFSVANGMDIDIACNELDIHIPAEWEIFVRTLSQKKKDVSSRLNKWGVPVPEKLMEKIDGYLPDDFLKLLFISEQNGMKRALKPLSWIHSDIMDDNVYMEPCCTFGSNEIAALTDNGSVNGHNDGGEVKSWRPNYIIDFSDLSIENRSITANDKFGRLSYQAMCYCILHDENVLGAIFSLWTELQTAETWEEVEQMVWGELSNYQGVACHVTPTPNL
ncbi:hypothetical protein CXB51_001046 [Gossypium anomalum]|uniref:F-box domain-containing protein n=1 Tax=Gossypium anomalum TaxID=47600 RepID=A0A8J6DEX1_9ROSI|nr:hypothetical protein CXB51_001046 [Gossypium anomalum]